MIFVMKVGLFIPCYINAVFPQVGVASYKLLKSLGVDVEYPVDQTCCGQPMGNAGFEREAAGLAHRFDEKFKDYEGASFLEDQHISSKNEP